MLGGASEPAACLLDKSKRHDFPKPGADSVVVDAVLAKVGVRDRQSPFSLPPCLACSISMRARMRCPVRLNTRMAGERSISIGRWRIGR